MAGGWGCSEEDQTAHGRHLTFYAGFNCLSPQSQQFSSNQDMEKPSLGVRHRWSRPGTPLSLPHVPRIKTLVLEHRWPVLGPDSGAPAWGSEGL